MRMTVDSSSSFGLLLLLLSLCCLGTWPAFLRLCSKPAPSSSSNTIRNDDNHSSPVISLCYSYVDYATAYVILSTLLMGVILWTQHDHSAVSLLMSPPLLIVAMLCGSLLSMGNLSFQWATCQFGAPLTTVLAIQASLTVVLGTSLNYWLEPQMTPRPEFLFCGVLVFLIAIGLAVRAQVRYDQAKNHMTILQSSHEEYMYQYQPTSNAVPADATAAAELCTETSMNLTLNNDEADASHSPYVSNQSAPFTPTASLELQQERFPDEISSSSPSSTAGVVTAISGGLAFGFFSPAFNIAVNDPFGWSHHDAASNAVVARANVWFSLAFWMASVVGNLFLLGKQSASWTELLRSYCDCRCERRRQWAIAAGLVCSLGNVLQFQGGQLVGYATSDLVQAYPLVSTVWDIVLFGEFRSCPRVVVWLLVAMYLAYGTGIGFLAASSMSGSA